MSQLLLVHSGLDSHITPIYAEKPTYKRERFALFQEVIFKLSRSEQNPQIKQTLLIKYVCKLLVCGCKGTTKFADVQEKSP